MSKILSLYPPAKLVAKLRLTRVEREHYAANQRKRLLKERRKKERKK